MSEEEGEIKVEENEEGAEEPIDKAPEAVEEPQAAAEQEHEEGLDEDQEPEVETRQAAPVKTNEKKEEPSYRSSFLPRGDDEEGNECEAKVRMEMELKKRKEKDEEEFAEYEAQRKIEREKEIEDIRLLRERREQRKKEREEEEKRLAELRSVEEQKRRAEEEERQRRKREEEQRKKEEREKKRMEADQRNLLIGKPNFVISKKDGAADEEAEGQEQKVVQKTKEQLEAEKRAALEQRCQPLNIAGFNVERLKEKAKELLQQIYRLESDKYDLMQRFEKQNYDMMQMSERARQMNKGGKNPKTNVPQTPDPLASKISGIPHKVQMYSQYERVKDPRSFVDRRDLFSGPMFKEEYERIDPSMKVVMTEQGARIEGGTPPHAENGENIPPSDNAQPVEAE